MLKSQSLLVTFLFVKSALSSVRKEIFVLFVKVAILMMTIAPRSVSVSFLCHSIFPMTSSPVLDTFF